MIGLEGVEVVFAKGTPLETRALNNVTLQIAEGEFVTVIGSNGAGKSTLLNAIAGAVPITSGRVVIGGEDVTGWPAARRARLVARVFQDPRKGTAEELTIEENLSLALGRSGRFGGAAWLKPALSSAHRDEFRARLATLGLGLENRLKDQMGLLSGGQRQAVSLVMATLCEAQLILLDEHTAALDPRMGTLVRDRTRLVIEDQGLTALMVTHSMRQAIELGSRTLMLHEGDVVLDVAGAERDRLSVSDLIRLFAEVRGEELDDDGLLMT